MKGDIIKFKKGKKFFYGVITGFKLDKIKIAQYRYSDLSGEMPDSYIEKEDIISVIGNTEVDGYPVNFNQEHIYESY